MRFSWHIIFVCIFYLGFSFTGFSQGIGDFDVENISDFTPIIKDAAVKQNDQPEISDTVAKIKDIKFTSPAIPFKTSYQTSQIEPAKMVNEPLSKLYQSLIKVGMGNYTMPYADIFLNSLRSKELVWGIRYNHLSSYAKFTGLGRTDFSDDNANLYIKKFYKKHTLSADANYSRNSLHYYGFQDSLYKAGDASLYKQFFQTFEGKLRLQSHYPDSGKAINHDIRLHYYNYGDHYNTFENNIFASAFLNTKVNHENINALISADYYNTQSTHDTLNNLIVKLTPYFNAGGTKWNMLIGPSIAMDNVSSKSTKYYIFPLLNIYYDIYQHLIIPYAGADGGLNKNSYRSLSGINPFVLSSLTYKNTNNVYNIFGGLRGALSSNTSYDAKVQYSQYNNMPFFLEDYTASSDNLFANRYKVVYMNTMLLNINAQVKYQFKEKINFIAKGNYYGYTLIDTSNAKPWHKPNFDLTFSAHYNLKSKILLKADIFVIGKQWAQPQINLHGVNTLQAVQLKGITDINLGAEYRYTKMLSFFASFNNIGNFRYYRWANYPTQRFNFMLGLSFTPF